MQSSETNRIKENYIYAGYQNIIPIQQQVQLQGQPIIILSQPLQQVIQFQPTTQNQQLQYQQYNYQQTYAMPAQPVKIAQENPNSELINQQNSDPTIKNTKKESKELEQNKKLPPPEKKSNSDSSEKKYICRYCDKPMNTVEKRCFNVCTCLFYIFYVLFYPIIIIISILCRSGAVGGACECNCYDIDYKCPYCGGTIESIKSCPLHDCCCCCCC